MNNWYIEYWHSTEKNSVEYWLTQLNDAELKSVAKELNLLACAGNELKMPHSKALSAGLFELRERRYGDRIYFAFQEHQRIILLMAGNKKSQQNDIILARQRLAELERDAHENKKL